MAKFGGGLRAWGEARLRWGWLRAGPGRRKMGRVVLRGSRVDDGLEAGVDRQREDEAKQAGISGSSGSSV